MAKELAIIVDVDGTLADMRGVRGPFEWDKVHLDRPHQDIINLVKGLAGIQDNVLHNDEYPAHMCPDCGMNCVGCSGSSVKKYKIIITTGRDGVCEEATRQWLTDHGVPFDDFYIRKAGDFRKDNIIKSEIYMDHIRPKYDVKFVIDDRDQVVEMWRSLGLRVLQVAPGNF